MDPLRALQEIVDAWDAWVASGCGADAYRVLLIRLQAARATLGTDSDQASLAQLARIERRRLPVAIPAKQNAL